MYAIDGQVTQLTNALTDVPTSEAVGWMYNGLYRYNESLVPIPDLAAEEATISEDGLTWTIKLVENATFQPGGANMTADDVVFTYQMSNSPNCRFNPSICLANVVLDDPDTEDDPEDPAADDTPVLTSVSKVDDYTVEFVLSQPYAPFATVTLPGTLIDSKAAVEAAFADFQEASGQVQDAQITDLNERIAADAALGEDEEADPENPATNPDPVQFRGELETILADAGIEDIPQPDPALFPLLDPETGEETGELDEAAYVGALIGVFTDLVNSRAAQGIDAIAAAYPLLSISRAPVGTGPFYVTEFNPGASIELTANPDYHFGAPALEGLSIPIITDDVAGASALIGGQIDWKYSMTADSYNAVKDAPNVKLAQYPDFGYFGLQFNLREGKLFADPNLRQALALCIQKPEAVEAATQGQGIAIYADIPPASWAYNEDVEKYPFNAEAGKALIEESGWTLDGTSKFRGDNTTVYQKDGQTLGTQVLVRAGKPDRIAFMGFLADQSNQNCGFDISIKEVDFGTVLVPMLSWPHAQQGKEGQSVIDKQFDAYFGGWGTGFDPDPYSIYHSSQCTTPDQPDTYNYICYQNKQADKLIEQGLAELDQAKRAEIYKEFEAILAKDLPYLFAWSDIAREGVNASVNGAEQWTPENMNTPTWAYQLEKITKTEQ